MVRIRGNWHNFFKKKIGKKEEKFGKEDEFRKNKSNENKNGEFVTHPPRKMDGFGSRIYENSNRPSYE